MPSLPTALFENLLREVLTQLNNDLDISGSNATIMSRTPRNQMENLIFSAMAEEDSQQSIHSITPSRTIEEVIEEVIEEPIAISHTELYSFGEHYQTNTGNYISSMNNSIELLRFLYTNPILAQHRHPTRINSNNPFYELDDLIYNYNSNNQTYNENIRIILGLLNNSENRPTQLHIPSSTFPPIPSSTFPPLRTSPPISIQSRPEIVRLETLSRNPIIPSHQSQNTPIHRSPETRLYMLFPPLNTHSTTERPVGLTLSNEQYDRSIERSIYRTNDISGNSTENCPICYEEFVEGDIVTKILHCGHVFKTVPLNNWFLRSSTCPVCRYDLHTIPQSAVGTSIDL